MTATLHLIAGPPGPETTARARGLERTLPALRLSSAEWIESLFGGDGGGDARPALEGRLLGVALQAVALGVDVVLDLGGGTRDDRSAIRALVARSGGRTETVRLPDPPDPVSTAAGGFEPPDLEELTDPDPATRAHRDWLAWAGARWPTLRLPESPGTHR